MTAIKKDVTIGDCRLILGDCLEVMKELGPVDAVVTDPPYGIDPDGAGYGRDGRGIKNDFNEEVMQMGVNMALSLMPRGIAAMFYSAKITPRVFGGQMATSYFGEIIWDKKAPGMGGRLRYQHENIALMSIGGAALADNCFSILTHYRCGKVHPHEKPISLMMELLGIVGGECVLDCFMGSGTTLVACAKMGRKGIGIELDPDYFEIACKRVQEAYDQPDLFVEQPAPPEQTGMDI